LWHSGKSARKRLTGLGFGYEMGRGMARVAVLLGGLSPERPVSLSTGAGAVAALKRLGHEVIEVDPQNAGWISQLADMHPDVAFNTLHGEWGEDGRIQGVLEYLKIPYTHSGVLSSALAMDKDKAKAIFRLAGIPVAEGKLMDRLEAAKNNCSIPIGPMAIRCWSRNLSAARN
jgi:D-alanine-D-alanine ligase